MFAMLASGCLLFFGGASCGTESEELHLWEEPSGQPDEPKPEDGNLHLSPLFSPGMVLQQNARVAIFGTADPGTPVRVTASWGAESETVHTSEDGKFLAYIQTPAAGGPYTMQVNDLSFGDILIGEVWICSGQSNMQFTLSECYFSGVWGETNTNIRMFRVPFAQSENPETEMAESNWLYGKTNDVGNKMSAVGYYFARRLQQELGVPIGMISSSRGGTGVEEWMSATCFESLPASIRAQYVSSTEKWPGCWYNAMIHPLLPYTVSGVIWYQGENNWNRPSGYHTLLPAMIEQWREDFDNPEMPFYLVQLTSFSTKWMEMREMQEIIADETPHSGYVPTIDVGEEKNIHPRKKQPVGERLAELALSKHYGKSGFRESGPRFDRMEKEGDKLRLHFKYTGQGLKLTSGEQPAYFEVAGADKVYHPAEALLEDNTVLVWSDEVSTPTDVRYFWVGFGEPNLFSEDGWPVAQFRTR